MVSVDGRARGECQVRDLEIAHHPEDVKSRQKRIPKIDFRILRARADIGIRRHVPHAVERRGAHGLFQRYAKRPEITEIRLEELEIRVTQRLREIEVATPAPGCL